MAHQQMNGACTNGSTHETNGFNFCHVSNDVIRDDPESVDDVDDDARSNFLKQVFRVLLEDGVKGGTDINSKVVEFAHPEELESRLDLNLQDNGVPDTKLIQMCRDTIHYSVRTGHRRFFNQLFSSMDEYGLAGAWLTETLNTSQYTYEVAPVFTLMEKVVLAHMGHLAGYTHTDGIFCPGGSIANMYGMNLARFSNFPEIKEEGMSALPKICIFTSEQAHYSVKKSAALLGIGTKYIIEVSCNNTGQMDTVALENAILHAQNLGWTPFLVNATSGTTVAGAYDPIDVIADVCTRHKLWLHVDCCWGGGALLSTKHKHLLNGLERSDSLSWNPHKMMGAPLQCCAFLTRHQGVLQNCHSAHARYLFQQDKFYDVTYDTGDKSVQCGRKVDVFKLWLMWKAHGDLGMEGKINIIFDNAKYLAERLRQRAGFRLVFAKPECTNVCFWYIPPCLRDENESKEWWQKLAQVAPIIKERMVMKGSMLIGYQPLGNKVNFFRMVISNPETTRVDMDFVIQEIDTLGRDIAV